MKGFILIGAPGSGKSSVGKALARELNASYLDTDAKIVTVTGKHIPDIFAELGEAGFRKIEREVVLNALVSDVEIISLGGGSIVDPLTQAAVSTNDRSVIYLTVGIGNAVARISDKADRPLVADDPKNQWLILVAKREPIYERLADLKVSTDNRKAPEVAHEIVLKMLKMGEGGHSDE